MRTPRRVLTALAALALLLAAAPARAAEEATYDVWHWNVAGNTLHEGSTSDGMVDAAVGSIRNRDADFVSVNELCRQQYRAIQSTLRAVGWPADDGNFSRFSESLPGGGSACAGEPYGNAIFSRAPLGKADRLELPDDGRAEQRTLLCAPLRDRAALRFCTTHITTSNEVGPDGRKHNEAQLAAVFGRLDGYHDAGETVLIGGDFNAQPDYGRMNPYYSSELDHPNNADNTGHYREVDDDDPRHCPAYGEKTVDGHPENEGPCGTGAKIDQIFVHQDRVAGAYSGDSLSISQSCGGPCSDHRILIGSIPVRIG